MTLKTSHIQELKRRYASMYTKEETLDEHCGVCDEQGIEEAKPPRKLAKRDVGMECMECGNKFRAKLSTLQYGKTKCPNCKSTDLDFAYGESVEEEVEIDEAFFKVKIPDVAPTFIEASSAGAVKSSMRKVLKPDVVADLEIERVTPAAMKKMYRDMAQGKDEVDESVVESNELQAIMALDDVGIKATINKKDQVVVKKKDLKKAEDALKKSFRKGGAPELHVEEVEIEEGTAYPPTIDNLRMIVKDKQHQTFMFKSGQAIVDLFTASAMVQVYDALKKPEMKKTFEKMIKDKAGFLKTQAFAMKMLSGGK